MTNRKLLALVIFISFLGAQIFVVFCPYRIMWGKNWANEDMPLWPFKRYPMYSGGRHPGDHLTFYELKVKSSNNLKMTNVDYDTLHVMPERFKLFVTLAKLQFDSTFTNKKLSYRYFGYLNYLIKQYIPNAVFAEIWIKNYLLTRDGIKDFNVKWKLSCSWHINNTTNNDISFYKGKNEVDN